MKGGIPMYCPEKKPPVPFPQPLLALRETIAESIHDAWAAGRIAEGWRYGEVLDAAARTHPSLRPYGELPESEKEYDRRTAAATISCILENGYRIERNES